MNEHRDNGGFGPDYGSFGGLTEVQPVSCLKSFFDFLKSYGIAGIGVVMCFWALSSIGCQMVKGRRELDGPVDGRRSCRRFDCRRPWGACPSLGPER